MFNLFSSQGDSDESSMDFDPSNDNSIDQNSFMPFRGLVVDETIKSLKFKPLSAKNNSSMQPLDLSKSAVILESASNRSKVPVPQPFSEFGAQEGRSTTVAGQGIPIIAEKPLIQKLKSSEFWDNQSLSSDSSKPPANQPPNLSGKSQKYPAQAPIPVNNTKAEENLFESNLISSPAAPPQATFNNDKPSVIIQDISPKSIIPSKNEKPNFNKETGIDSNSFPIPFQSHKPEIPSDKLPEFDNSTISYDEVGENNTIKFSEPRIPPPPLRKPSQPTKERENETHTILHQEKNPYSLLMTSQVYEQSSKKSIATSEIPPVAPILSQVGGKSPEFPIPTPLQSSPKLPIPDPTFRTSASTPSSKKLAEAVPNQVPQNRPQLPPSLIGSSGNIPILPGLGQPKSTEKKTEPPNRAPTSASQPSVSQFSALPPDKPLMPLPKEIPVVPPPLAKTVEPKDQLLSAPPQLTTHNPQIPFTPSNYGKNLPQTSNGAPSLEKSFKPQSSENTLSRSQVMPPPTLQTYTGPAPAKLNSGFDKESPQVPKLASPSPRLPENSSNAPIIPPQVKREVSNFPPPLTLSKVNDEESKINGSSPPQILSLPKPPQLENSSGTVKTFIPPPLLPNSGSKELNLDPFKHYTENTLSKVLSPPNAPENQRAAAREASCYQCNSRAANQILRCKHNLCEDCLEKIVTQTAENRLYYCLSLPGYDLPVFCPHCNSRLPPKLYNSKHYIGDLYKKCKERYRSLVNSNEVCFGCGVMQPADMFYQKNSCKHMCKDCVSSFRYAGINSCKYCSQRFNEEHLVENELLVCGSCDQQKSARNGLFLHLCKLHVHCEECVLNAIKQNKCGECKCELGEDDWRRVNSRIRIIKLAY